MEQRPLRLGDMVDDYCPRERRITNHAVVVMSGDEIAQTRCAACEAEHPYKHAKAPSKKKKDEQGALYDEVLAGVLKPKHVVHEVVDPVEAVAEVVAQAEVAVMDAPAEPIPESEPEPVAASWGHRPLIRAQLPRIEGQAPVIPRPLPEFTIRQQGARGYGQANQSNGQSRRGQGGGSNNQHNGHGNGHGGGQGRGGRDQGGRSQGRSRHSR